MKLGVNIDHIATLREQRKEDEPDLLRAAQEVILAGADSITIHLREDRRHIQDQDVFAIKKIVPALNLEMSISTEIVDIACQVQPKYACLVPEKRAELTTEGGLDVISQKDTIKKVITKLQEQGIIVSIFIDPDQNQIQCTKDLSANAIEIHTGTYAITQGSDQEKELQKIKQAAIFGKALGLQINAGHGLKYHNVKPIAQIPEIQELNIGHSIISHAIFTGLKSAVQEIKSLITSN